MILPLQKNQNNSAKYLILLGSWDQKPGKTGFGVELGGAGDAELVGREAFVLAPSGQ